jgi:hypothetical protein
MADPLRNKLEELKLAFYSPRLYITEFCSRLRNQIDVTCEQSRLSSPGEQAIHLQMISQVDEFERNCLAAFTADWIDEKLTNLVRNTISLEDRLNQEQKYVIASFFSNQLPNTLPKISTLKNLRKFR